MPDRASVLVTGASRGIGRATAEQLAANGRDVVLWARDTARLRETAAVCAGHGVRCTVQTVDVREEASVERAVAQLEAESTALDALVLNAGVGRWQPLAGHPAADWDEIQSTNLRGAFLVLSHALPLLLRDSRPQAVVLGSDSGLYGFADRAAYCASKWGLRGLLEVAREEHRGDGLRCTHLAVSAVDTGFRIGRPGSRPGALAAREVAEAVAWVLSLPPSVEVRELHLSSVSRPFGPGPAARSVRANEQTDIKEERT